MNKKWLGILFCGVLSLPLIAHEGKGGRHAAMKELGENMKTLSKMAKGEESFDAEIANNSLSHMSMLAKELTTMFPEGSLDEVSEASPKIWEEPEEFENALNQFIADAETAAASEPADQEALGASLGLLGKNCKSCHEDYRIKKD